MQIQSRADLRKVAREVLHAHGTHIVALPFEPPIPDRVVAVGDAQALRALLPNAKALKPATLRLWMQTMTRLGLPTTYNPEQFALNFDADAESMLRAVNALLDQRPARGRSR